MRTPSAYLLSFLLFVFFWSCKKELSVEKGTDNGGVSNDTYGWSFTGNNAAYKGCVDSAYYETQNGVSALFIEASDSADNSLVIFIAAPSGKVSAGNYTPAQGAGIMFQSGSATYTTTQNSDVVIKITAVNDTLVEGSFSGTLSVPAGGGTFKITDGKIKALIGKANPCGPTGPPVTPNTAVYSLKGSPNNCSDFNVQGTYKTGTALAAANKVTLKVNVTTAGSWSITTSTVNGIKFSGSGNFTTPGDQEITLQGSGTPTNADTITVPVTAGASTCSFKIVIENGLVVQNNDYFPLSTNSNWVYYEGNQSGTYDDSTETTSTGATQVISSKTYKVLDGGIMEGLYRKDASGVYYRYGSVDFFSLIDSVQVEVPFLKENAAKNTSWESPVVTDNDNGIQAKYKTKFTVIETNITQSVMGVSYDKVIVIKEELMESTNNLPFVAFHAIEVSYAKGVGVIQIKDPAFDEIISLKRYKVF